MLSCELSLTLVFALRFRAIVALALAAFTLFGTWHVGDPSPVLAIVIGSGFYVVLSTLAGFFGDHGGPREDIPARGYSYADEQARSANQYHRRQRESRF